jgi:hypothetical protein
MQARRRIRIVSLFSLALAVLLAGALSAQEKPTILTRDQAGTLIPATVFFRGQIAPVQARNSAGLRFHDSKLFLAALVDASGYASSVQETYQGYLITEVALKIKGKTLPPGAYGFGFIAGDRMVAMDVGGNDVLSVATARDAQMARPNPLQIVSDATSPDHFRLYLGRSYVILEAAEK